MMPSNHLILYNLLLLLLSVFPRSGTLPVSWPFASGGQSFGASTSTSVLPMNIQDWFPLRWTDFNSLLSKGLSRVFSSATIPKYQFYSAHPSLCSKSHFCTWPTGKTIVLVIWTFVGHVMSAFTYTVYVCHSFSSKDQASFDFMAAVTSQSDIRINLIICQHSTNWKYISF